MSITAHGIDIQRIHDIVDMTCHNLVWQLHREGIQLSDTPQPQGSDCLYFVMEVPFEAFGWKFDRILAIYLLPHISMLPTDLKKEDNGEATWCGVQCIRETEEGFLFSTLVAQTAEPPVIPPPANLYESWKKVILL